VDLELLVKDLLAEADSTPQFIHMAVVAELLA
jgi:hypothetical protein